ncbi:zinc finger TRAF-type-containing protein 1-B isoform 1-T1 [Morphnus guianensis]
MMSGAEDREAGGGPAAPSAPSAVLPGPAAAAATGGPGEAGGAEEAGSLLGGARPHGEAGADPDAPPKKRLRAAGTGTGGPEGAAGSVKLEERLYSVLCCTVCLDLPKASVYQCTNGHLMCAGCFIHLLADARLKEEQATCPNCRCEISKSLCCRNLAVEKAVSELPSECGFCMQQFPRSLLERHQKEECQDRVTQCKYKRIGCPWQGPYHELTVHEAECTHPTKTGNELMEILDEMDQTRKKEMQLYNSIFSLLSFEKIGYTGFTGRALSSPSLSPGSADDGVSAGEGHRAIPCARGCARRAHGPYAETASARLLPKPPGTELGASRYRVPVPAASGMCHRALCPMVMLHRAWRPRSPVCTPNPNKLCLATEPCPVCLSCRAVQSW